MKSIVFYLSWEPFFSALPDEQAGRIIKGIFSHMNGQEPAFDNPSETAIYTFIASQIDKDVEKYNETCKKRAEAGRAGGLKKAEANASKSLAKDSKPEQTEGKYKDKDKNKNKYNTSKVEVYADNVCSIPLDNNEEYRLTEDYYQGLCKTYPSVDVRAEMMKMRTWCVSNPDKRKTARGIKRAINSWVSHAAEWKAEKAEKKAQGQYKTNQFTNFEQRDYSQQEIDELERRLLTQ